MRPLLGSAAILLPLLACHPGPRAVMLADWTRGPAPLTVSFDGTQTRSGAEITEYHWDIGDGTEYVGPHASHTFVDPGEYDVVLTVTDDQGRSSDTMTRIGVFLPDCPSFEEPVVAGIVSAPAILEASGLVASPAHPETLWVHNDSGHPPHLHAIDTEGASLGVVILEGAGSIDWEDIALGPSPDADGPHLYVGDIGDNRERRDFVTIYRLPEPPLPDDPGTPLVFDDWVALEATYPDGAHDAETLLVDPLTGEILIGTKAFDGVSRFYRYPLPQRPEERVELELVAELDLTPEGFNVYGLPLLTAGDLSPDGAHILLRTYTGALLWHRGNGSIVDALASRACDVPLAGEPQGEAIGFAPDGQGYWTLSEGADQPLYWYAAR